MSHTAALDQKNLRLAKKSVIATAILSFVFPPVGYLYTGRWAALLLIGLISIPSCSAFIESPETDPNGTALGIYFLTLMFALFENTFRVLRAKSLFIKELDRKYEAIIDKSQEQDSVSYKTTTDSNLDSNHKTLLKVLKVLGEATLADIVLQSDMPKTLIQTVLNECQQDDLIRAKNRESDGAVVYWVV